MLNTFLTKCSFCCWLDVCQQRVKPGVCMGYFPRWYFDSKLNKCKKFIFGGCRGNGNKFESIKECETTCLHASKSFSNQVQSTLLMIVLVCCLKQVPYFDVFSTLPLVYPPPPPPPPTHTHTHPRSLSLFHRQGGGWKIVKGTQYFYFVQCRQGVINLA